MLTMSEVNIFKLVELLSALLLRSGQKMHEHHQKAGSLLDYPKNLGEMRMPDF